jgi:hypothetical protein
VIVERDMSLAYELWGLSAVVTKMEDETLSNALVDKRPTSELLSMASYVISKQTNILWPTSSRAMGWLRRHLSLCSIG